MRTIGLMAALLLPNIGFADPSYALKIETPAAQKAKRAVVKLHVTPGAGFHMNQQFPTVVSVVGPAGVTVEHPKQNGKDAVKFDEHQADFDVAFVAADAGKKQFSGEFKFAVCSATSCDPKKEKLSFAVEVK